MYVNTLGEEMRLIDKVNEAMKGQDTEFMYAEDSVPIAGAKKAELNSHNATMSDDYKSRPDTDIIGWFSNKFNLAGWGIYALSKADVLFLNEQGYPSTMIFRMAGDRGTFLAKVDLKKGKVQYFDDDKYEKTDKLEYKDKLAYTKLVVNNRLYAAKAFQLKYDATLGRPTI